jgi:hypothetical protein
MKASEKQVAGSHYCNFSIQPGEFIHRNGIGFLEGNVIKYVCRHRNKNGRQDIEKAIHYLQLLMEWEYPERTAASSRTEGGQAGSAGAESYGTNRSPNEAQEMPKTHFWLTAEQARMLGYAP